MPRARLFEIHDQPWFPDFLRREVVDSLQMVLEATNAYQPISHRLRDAIESAGSCEVLDLFSGAGGPWPSLVRDFNAEGANAVEVFLTDKYPSSANCNHTNSSPGSHTRFLAEPVDATDIPASLTGFRTIFSSFHHFNAADARQFLQESASKGRGVGIFEVASRHSLTMLSILFIPILAWLATPFRTPFRWSRLLWTYLVPVVPLVLLFDGISSCLRAYSLDDLRSFTGGLATNDYKWEIGEESGGLLSLSVTYVIGAPHHDRNS